MLFSLSVAGAVLIAVSGACVGVRGLGALVRVADGVVAVGAVAVVIGTVAVGANAVVFPVLISAVDDLLCIFSQKLSDFRFPIPNSALHGFSFPFRPRGFRRYKGIARDLPAFL